MLGTLSLFNVNRVDEKEVLLIRKTEKAAYLPGGEEGENVAINIDFLLVNILHPKIVGLYCRGNWFSVRNAIGKNSTKSVLTRGLFEPCTVSMLYNYYTSQAHNLRFKFKRSACIGMSAWSGLKSETHSNYWRNFCKSAAQVSDLSTDLSTLFTGLSGIVWTQLIQVHQVCLNTYTMYQCH